MTTPAAQPGAAVGKNDGGYMRPIFLNPLLCFLVHKIGRHPAKDLKDTIKSFYTVESVLEAKEALHFAMSNLGGRATPS